MPTWGFRLFWAVWATIGLAIEVWAVWFDKEKGDTLSEQVWLLLAHPLLWWMAAGLLVWAIIHFLGFGRFG